VETSLHELPIRAYRPGRQHPVNVRDVNGLLGHTFFDRATEKHYIMGQSRLAGRALAEAIDIVRGRSTS
jgi:hypothetical protein